MLAAKTECFCHFLQGKEIKTVVYAAVVAFSLYVYIDHFLSNDQTRVRHLGLICIVLTITMQASPLATVVCQFCFFPLNQLQGIIILMKGLAFKETVEPCWSGSQT